MHHLFIPRLDVSFYVYIGGPDYLQRRDKFAGIARSALGLYFTSVGTRNYAVAACQLNAYSLFFTIFYVGFTAN